jgi:hypothetical protein
MKPGPPVFDSVLDFDRAGTDVLVDRLFGGGFDRKPRRLVLQSDCSRRGIGYRFFVEGVAIFVSHVARRSF